MVRSAGGKRTTGRDMTKTLVKSHVATQPARHAKPMPAPQPPQPGGAKRPRRARKATAKM